MLSTPRQFRIVGKACNRFLPAKDKDSHELCTVLVALASLMIFLNSCHDWSGERWEKVTHHHEKLTIHYEKRGRKAGSKCSSSFFSGFTPSILPIPLLSIDANPSSFNVVVTTMIYSSDGAITYVTTSPIRSSKSHLSNKYLT